METVNKFWYELADEMRAEQERVGTVYDGEEVLDELRAFAFGFEVEGEVYK